VNWARQAEQKGTATPWPRPPAVSDQATVLVLYGDVPLIRPQTLQELLQAAVPLPRPLTAELEQPAGYGRIIRHSRPVARIVKA
jgi:bifunctional UDP-N-acetylglucosamine pyrophosphorylase/glucosamine-1-phosphate N-acetyltransferase